jgi:membrane protein
VGQLLAFGFIWVLFVLVYRYLPPRRIPWRTALTAATFTGILFEGTKYLFSWYVTNAANITTVYGGLTAAAILFFWIYYGSIVFILGGEVAQVYTMHRTRRLHTSNGLPSP